MDIPPTSSSFNSVSLSRKDSSYEGQLTERPIDHCLITWTINDFLKLSYFAERSISSPPIQLGCSSDSWYISLFPYFLVTGENTIQFCLRRDASRDKTIVEVTYRFGVKKSTVTWLQEKVKISFTHNSSEHQLYDIVEYFGGENALKENTLTVMCEMYITYSQSLQIFYSRRLGDELGDLLQLSEALLNICKKVQTSDAYISVEGRNIPVHKAILAARSPVFAKILSNSSCINIPEEDFYHIPNILIYTYSTDFYWMAVNGVCIGFYECAKRYKIKGLTDILTPLKISVSSSLKEKNINFRWKIEKFSSLNIKFDESITSPPFHGGSKDEPVWYLDVYPEGSRRAPDSVGIFLRTKDVRYKYTGTNIHISILDESEQEHCTKSTDKLVYPNFYDFPEYVSKKELREADLLQGDKLIIKCTIKSLSQIQSYDKITSISRSHCEASACLEQLSLDMKNLLYDGGFSDCTLMASNNEMFAVHKEILSARSAVFEKIIEQDKCNEYIVGINDISPQVLEEIIHFAYTGKMKAYNCHFSMELYEGAKTYGMMRLADKCSRNLWYTNDETSVCDVILFAHKHQENELFTRCLMCLKMFGDKILNSKEWQKLEIKEGNLAHQIRRWLEDPFGNPLSLTNFF